VFRWLIGRLARVTSSGRWIPEVDGLRFVAIAAVFVYHLRGYLAAFSSISWQTPVADDVLARVTEYGNLGVHLFFTLSGFILALPFADHVFRNGPRVSPKAYFLRRLTRLEPPYLLTLFLFFGLYAVTGRRLVAEMLPNLLANCFYVHNWFGAKDGSINTVAWSLEIEVQFYVLAPLLAAIFRVPSQTARRTLLVGAAYAAVLLQVFVLDKPRAAPISLLNYLQFFLMGFLAADIYVADWRGAASRSAGWDLVWLAGGGSIVYLAVLESVVLPWALPGLMFILIAASFRVVYCRRFLTNPLVTAIGGMCYTIYLIHYQVISFVGRFTCDWALSRYFFVNLLVQTAVIGAVTLLVAAVFFLLVEKPCMKPDWPRRLWLSLGRVTAKYRGTPESIAPRDSPLPRYSGGEGPG
jgi:peptidoglycan/LPS O-acetylase OafA/YrhL